MSAASSRKRRLAHRVESGSVYVVDGKRFTCPGGLSSIDVALHLVERHCGRSMPLKVARGMIIEAIRSARHAQPHPETKWFREVKMVLMQRAILLMEQQPPAQHVVVRGIAAQLGVSPRTPTRGFPKSF